MNLSQEQLKKIETAYVQTSEVLNQVDLGGTTQADRSTIFELSAAVGVLRTLLIRNNHSSHAYQPTERQ